MAWYVVMSKSRGTREEGHPAATEAEHRAWLKEHHDAGTVLFSGPTTNGPGIWVLKAASREEAEAMLQTHPWVKAGIRDVSEMYEWNVRQVLGAGFAANDRAPAREAEATRTS